MENDNLIEFTSPANSPQNHRTSSSLPSISSNPFDEPPVLNINYPTIQQRFVSPSKINFEDFTCDFLCGEAIGRESLLLTNDYARESLGILDLDDLDIGRPSLGIERLKIMKKSLNNNSNDNSILNKAFLYSPEDKNETTVFSTTTNSSFNSNSLNTNLFSYSSIKVADLTTTTTTTNILNKRLYNSGEFYDQFNKFNHTTRISSLPASLTIQEDDEDLLTYKLWNSAITSNSNDDLDPILIEATLIADRIKNGLIFSEALDSTYTIEHTKQPFLVDNSYKDSRETSQESDKIPNKSNQNNTSSSPPSYDDCINNNNSNNHCDDTGSSSSIENHHQLNDCLDQVLDLRLKISQDDTKLNSSDDLPLDLSIKSKDYEFVQPKIILSKSSDKQQKNSINNNSNRNNNNNQSQNDLSNLSKFSFKTTSNNSSSTSINSNNNSSLKIKRNEEKRKIGPLKAVIPIDNMLKTPVLYNATTPKIETKLKKTSTPINESKMWPIAQSTPDTPSNKLKLSPLEISDQQQSDCEKRLNYSDSNLSSDPSKSINKSDDNRRLRYSWSEEDQKKQQSKSFLQRRSLSDLKRPQVSKYDQQQHSIPRSYSAGKDPKILSSIKRVRQTINKNDNKSKGLYRNCSIEEKASQITDKSKVNLKKDHALNENITRVGNNRKSVVKGTGKENLNR